MTSKRMTFLVLGLGVIAAIGSASSAFAWSKDFPGTQNQVRSACANVGGMLIEDVNQTTCWNSSNGTLVTCDSDNACSGSGPGTGPNRVSSIEGLFAVRPKTNSAAGSLSGSGSESGPSPTGGLDIQIFSTPQPPIQVMAN